MYFLFLILSLVLARQINVAKLACDVKITEIPYSKDLIPAKINPGNFTDLQLALQCCNIEKAQVAGWNDHNGTFILYKNGTVVPARMDDLPNVALFFKRCGCKNLKTICVYDHDKPNPKCLLPCAYPTSISNVCIDIPGFPTPCIEKQSHPIHEKQPYHIPERCQSPTSECVYESVKQLPKPYDCIPSCFTGCDSKIKEFYKSKKCNNNKCPVFVKQLKLTECEDGIKKKKNIETLEVCSYRCVKIKDKPQAIARVISKCSESILKEINLSKEHEPLSPEILNKPKKIFKIKRCIEKYLQRKVCIYTTPCNKLYIFVDNELWLISFNKKSLVLTKQSERKIEKLCSKGLISITFDE